MNLNQTKNNLLIHKTKSIHEMTPHINKKPKTDDKIKLGRNRIN